MVSSLAHRLLLLLSPVSYSFRLLRLVSPVSYSLPPVSVGISRIL
jgi:hypothetical protein